MKKKKCIRQMVIVRNLVLSRLKSFYFNQLFSWISSVINRLSIWIN